MAVSHLPGKLNLSAYMFEPCHPASYGCCLNTHQSSATTDILQTHTMIQPASTRLCASSQRVLLLHMAPCKLRKTHTMACKTHGCTATQRSTSPYMPQSRKGLLGHLGSTTLLCQCVFQRLLCTCCTETAEELYIRMPYGKACFPYLKSASQLIIQVLDALCQGPAVHQEGAAAPDEHGCQQITLDTMACQESALSFDPVEALSQHKWPPACKIVRLMPYDSPKPKMLMWP